MEKYGLNAAGNLARGALFCSQLCQRFQKAAVIRGGGMAFGLGQQPADFASGGAAIYLGLVAVAADTNLSGFDLGGDVRGWTEAREAREARKAPEGGTPEGLRKRNSGEPGRGSRAGDGIHTNFLALRRISA